MTSLYAYFDVFNENFPHYQVLITPPHFETGESFHFRVSLPLFLSPNVALAAIAFSSRYYTTLSTRSFADFLSVRT